MCSFTANAQIKGLPTGQPDLYARYYCMYYMKEATGKGSYVLKSGNIKKELSVELFDTQISQTPTRSERRF